VGDDLYFASTLFFPTGTGPSTSFLMTNIRTIFGVIVIAASLSACTGNAPTSKGVSYVAADLLSSYKTFGWSADRTLSLREPERNTAEAKGWIESALESGFTNKGLTKTSAESADLLVSYGVGSRTLTSSQTFTEEGEFSQSQKQEDGGSGQAWGRSATLNSDYEQGRLILTVTDRKTGKVVYQGTSEAELLERPSASKSTSRIQKAVKGMLKNWPTR
jgi:hypothetical protein